jgi:membrane-bound lytic murein transglycosylase MltF
LQGWAVRKNNPELLASLNREAQKIKKGTLLGNMLFNRFYKNTRWIKNPSAQSDQKKLGQFVHLFKKYGALYGFDHYALIAQAYQESRLDNDLKSHRGAVGIMQVLPTTAADRNINIANIYQLENNIHAGTKYLHFLRQRYFSDPDISPLDQMAFTWAAYNAGPARVRKMRHLAWKMGLDQNRWFNNVEVAAGKIVGVETVRYVSNIYKYYVAYQLVEKADKKRVAFN